MGVENVQQHIIINSSRKIAHVLPTSVWIKCETVRVAEFESRGWLNFATVWACDWTDQWVTVARWNTDMNNLFFANLIFLFDDVRISQKSCSVHKCVCTYTVVNKWKKCNPTQFTSLLFAPPSQLSLGALKATVRRSDSFQQLCSAQYHLNEALWH